MIYHSIQINRSHYSHTYLSVIYLHSKCHFYSWTLALFTSHSSQITLATPQYTRNCRVIYLHSSVLIAFCIPGWYAFGQATFICAQGFNFLWCRNRRRSIPLCPSDLCLFKPPSLFSLPFSLVHLHPLVTYSRIGSLSPI